ncbi:hypothetical protein [Roseofilum sp. Guam]|uniref:hypothetical protein n=1 Tax=Roseofilum sp. Guam TaxID=2821502 RepID=UPI001B2E8F4B|nr:hypothetical protein [Roseofilum sp. Guam]MBP0027205.1 hypothetical protein [Roseofilum sp. Guam]
MINSFPVINPELIAFATKLFLFLVEKVIIPLATLAYNFAMANPQVIIILIIAVAVVLIFRWAINKGYAVDSGFGFGGDGGSGGISIRPA